MQEVGVSFPEIPESTWLTLPFSSYPTYSYSQFVPDDTVSLTAELTGNENVTVHLQTVAMQLITENVYLDPDNTFVGGVTSASRTIDYSPQTGVFGPTNELTNQIDGTSGYLKKQTLIAFAVK